MLTPFPDNPLRDRADFQRALRQLVAAAPWRLGHHAYGASNPEESRWHLPPDWRRPQCIGR